MNEGLTRVEILRLATDYIGGVGGYLGDFSYATLQEFYPYYCGLSDIETLQVPERTTRKRFIWILEQAEPSAQAKILRGVLQKYPLGSEVPDGSGAERSAEIYAEIEQWIARLEGPKGVSNPQPTVTSAVVERAIRDAETLLIERGATSGVDRIHTALHGYIEAVCDAANIAYVADTPLPALFATLRKEHPAFQVTVASAEITKVLRSMGAILDAVSLVRNRASMAHPNRALLDEPEALLVINAARTLLHYLDAKLSHYSP